MAIMDILRNLTLWTLSRTNIRDPTVQLDENQRKALQTKRIYLIKIRKSQRSPDLNVKMPKKVRSMIKYQGWGKGSV